MVFNKNKNSADLQEVDLAAAATVVLDVESGRHTATPVATEATTTADPIHKLTTTTITETERTWAMLAHLSAFSGFIIPFGNIIGPLLVLLFKGDEDSNLPFVRRHAKESLNFQIILTIYTLIACGLVFLLVGIILLPILFVLEVVFIIIASMKANEGEEYDYPLVIYRFVR